MRWKKGGWDIRKRGLISWWHQECWGWAFGLDVGYMLVLVMTHHINTKLQYRANHKKTAEEWINKKKKERKKNKLHKKKKDQNWERVKGWIKTKKFQRGLSLCFPTFWGTWMIDFYKKKKKKTKEKKKKNCMHVNMNGQNWGKQNVTDVKVFLTRGLL